MTAATRAGSPHLLHPSIVGIDQMPSWGYTKTKLEAERIVQTSGLPWTILRVTQFYDYCLENSRKLAKFPVAPVPAGFRVQPVDPDEVAARLVELALGEPAGRAPDMAGPQVSSWADMFRSYLTASHRHRWMVPGAVSWKSGRTQRRSPSTTAAHGWNQDLGPVPDRTTEGGFIHLVPWIRGPRRRCLSPDTKSSARPNACSSLARRPLNRSHFLWSKCPQ